MTAYATVEQLETRMRTTFSEADSAYAEEMLEEASAYLAQVVEVDPDDEAQASNLKYACLSMVARVMDSALASDVSSMTMQAGSYAETLTYARPYATNNWWKLLKSSGYASRLGIGGGIGVARPSYGVLEVDDEARPSRCTRRPSPTTRTRTR